MASIIRNVERYIFSYVKFPNSVFSKDMIFLSATSNWEPMAHFFPTVLKGKADNEEKNNP